MGLHIQYICFDIWRISIKFFDALPLGWLVAYCEFPGKKQFEWALMLPLAMPTYIIAYVYTDLLDYAGPVQIWLRNTFGWQNPDDIGFLI